MLVAGIMSGTSADGMDVAIVRILGRTPALRFKLVAHTSFAYAEPVRKSILAAMNATRVSVADLSRLNFLLGELYADAVLKTLKQHGIAKIDLIGCHGQTLYHQGDARPFLGRKVACTWQAGEAAVLAARTQTPVVSNFRPADMAAGGKGAPLVPLLDMLLFRHRSRTRVAQNLGGIGNLTVVPAGAGINDVFAFDTGPGNMVIDQCMERLYQKRFDRNGAVAASGRALDSVVRECLQQSFFKQKPPRTAGREEFGREFVSRFLRFCGRVRKEDIIATATALTAASIQQSLERWVMPTLPVVDKRDYIVSGGGT